MDPSVILQVEESFASLGNILPITEELFSELFPRYVYHQHRVWVSGREYVADLEIPTEILDFHRNSGANYPELDYLEEYKPSIRTRPFLKTPNDTRIRIIHYPTRTKTILKTVFREVYAPGSSFTGSISPRLTLWLVIDVSSIVYQVMRKIRRDSKDDTRISYPKLGDLVNELYGEICEGDFLFGGTRTGECPRIQWHQKRVSLDADVIYSPEFHRSAFEIRTDDKIDQIFTKEEALAFISKTHLGKIFGRV